MTIDARKYGAFIVRNSVARIAVLVIFVALLGAALHPGMFLTVRNFTSIFRQLSEYGLLSLAVFICMVSGGIDLSVVYIANLCAIVVGIFLSTIMPGAIAGGSLWIIIASLIAVAIGIACGAMNGILVGYLRVPAMLATLGTGQLFLGISTVITGGKAISGVPRAFTSMAGISLGMLPLNFMVFLVCSVLMMFLMSRTGFGFKVQLIGSNPKAAVFSGLRNNRELLKVYIISGVLASISGIVSVMRMSSAKPDYGVSYVMYSILICVFGGTDPNGGKGNVTGIVLATIVLQMITTLMNMFNNLSAFYRDIVWGGALLLMLIVNYILDRK